MRLTLNKQNWRYRTGLTQTRETYTKRKKWNFGVGSLSWGLLGPIFFNETEQVDTVNSQRYVNMIEEFTIPQLEQYNYNMDEYYSEVASIIIPT